MHPLDYDYAPDAEFTPSNKFRILEFIPSVDTFVSSLDERIELRYGFLSKFYELTLSGVAQSDKRLLIVSIYKDNLDSNLKMEFLLFQQFFSELLEFKPGTGVNREQAMYSLIIETGVREIF